MIQRLTIDKAGRVVIPKPVRDSLRLLPGDALQLDNQEERITLTPVRDVSPLHKEKGVWVYRSGQSTADVSIPDLIERMRKERDQEVSG